MMYSCAPLGRDATTKVVKKRGKSLRVDIHCHYMNTDVAARVAHLNPAQHEPMAVWSNAATREANANQVKERGPKLTDIALRLKDMDRMSIDIQAVSPAPHQTYYWTDPGMGQELARTQNERLAEIVAQHPDRFVALGTVPLQDASLAVSELIHCVKTLGMRGVEINPSVKGMDRHPKLKVVLPHAGGYLAHYWARMDHAYKARPDTRGQIKRKPSTYLEKFYFDTITFDHGMLAHLIARFGAGHVLLGTDYPYDMGMERPIEFIEGVKGLSKAEAAAIEGGNAARLLKIDYNAAQ